MFLSLKKHWEHGSSEMSDALLQLCLMLLKAMRLHAVRGDAQDLRRFQAGVLDLEERLASNPDVKEVLVAAGETVRAFEDYNYETTRFFEIQRNELSAMMSMLTRTITSISSSGSIAVETLGKVEKRIEKGVAAGDLAVIKAELAACLETVREEAARQRQTTRGTVQAIKSELQQSRDRIAASKGDVPVDTGEPLVRDPATGLPSREDAESFLAHVRGRPRTYVAVLPVDRIALIQKRFGTESVHQILKFYAGFLDEHLLRGDRLFRWSSGAFIAVVEREAAADTVRAEISRYANAKTEFVLQHHGREILLPLTSTWLLVPASEGGSTSVLCRKIDDFLGSEVHLKESF